MTQTKFLYYVFLLTLSFAALRSTPAQDIELGFDRQKAEETAIVEISPDGNSILLGGSESLILWDFTEGRAKWRTKLNSAAKSVKFSPDSKLLLSVSRDLAFEIYSAATGKILSRFIGLSAPIVNAVISPDGKMIILVETSGTTRLFDMTSQRLISVFPKAPEVAAVGFSPDGGFVVTGHKNGEVLLWELKDNDHLVGTFTGFNGEITAVEFPKIYSLPKGEKEFIVLASSVDGTARLISFKVDLKKEKELMRLVHNRPITAIASSTNSKLDDANKGFFILTGDTDGMIQIWNPTQPELSNSLPVIIDSNQSPSNLSGPIKSLKGHSAPVDSVAFTADRKFVLSYSPDSTTRIWNLNTQKELCRIVLFSSGDWAVISPEGQFDSANDGNLDSLFWRFGEKKIPLPELKDEYYEPGLLRKILKAESLRAVVPLRDAKLPPEIISQVIERNSTTLRIKLKNRGGGFGAVRVFVNDKLAVEDARSESLKTNPNTNQEFVDLTVDLSNSAFVRGKICEDAKRTETCRDNKITVYASNYLSAYQTSNITSRGSDIIWLAGDDTSNFKLPTLYAIVGGVSNYTGTALDLKYAAKDADDFADALELGAQRLFCDKENPKCIDKVNIQRLSTSGNPNAIAPTKKNFREAFAKIAAKAEPEDIVLIYLSGHGVSLDDTDTYFYLTQEAASTDKKDLAKNYPMVSITSKELLCWMTTTHCGEKEEQLEYEGRLQLGNKALRQVIILDTCAAGKAGQTLALLAQKDLSTDQRRAIEFLKDKTGTHILMGSTADQPSYEVSKFGQGLLTRALLEGMSGAALEGVNDFIDVQRLFRYAENRVEKLAAGFGGIQRPTNAAPTGKTFLIGQMEKTLQKQIGDKLPKEKPYILSPSFGNSKEDNYDNLNINEQLAKLLNDENNPLMSKDGNDSVLVYLDEKSFFGAIKPTGFYRVENGVVTINVSLRLDGQKIVPTFEVKGTETEIVGKLLDAIRVQLRKLKQ